MLGFRSWWGLSEEPQADERRALDAARVAVEKDPESGRAQISLAVALNIAGNHDEALSAARRAPALSPSDPSVLAYPEVSPASWPEGAPCSGTPALERRHTFLEPAQGFHRT